MNARSIENTPVFRRMIDMTFGYSAIRFNADGYRFLERALTAKPGTTRSTLQTRLKFEVNRLI